MLLLRALAIVASPLAALASPNTISDQRIQDPSLTPALGRGYSLQTYDVLSTCLNFQAKTEPTYNYAYDYHDIESDSSMSSETKGALQGTLSWGFVRAQISGSMSVNKKTNKKSKYMVTTMSMERYYSSLDDTTAELTPHALSIINRGDLVGFFASCGSGYIRSIRRTAEITAIFEYTSSSENEVKDLAASMKVKVFGMNLGGGSMSQKSKSRQSNTDTKITIRAYGLGLNMEGANTLVATSLEDYTNAVEFAFKSMQNDDVGIIKGIEVVPWTSNLQFNDAVEFDDTEAIKFDESGIESIAKGGQINPETGVYDVTLDADGQATTDVDVTKNMIVSGIEVKAITTINAEFVTSMERKYATELRYLALARECSGALKSYVDNPGLAAKILVDHTKPSFKQPSDAANCATEKFFTVEQVNSWINKETLENREAQTKKFITNYYGPCATAITKYSRNGRMTKYWWDLEGCKMDMCEAGKVAQIEIDKDANTRTASGSQCVAAVAPAGDAPVSNLDLLIDMFCLPQFDEIASDLCTT